MQKELQFYTFLWPVLLHISIDQNLKLFLENQVFANKPDQFGFMCKIFFQFYSSLWLNQDNIIVFLVTGLQKHKQTETQTTTPPQTKNQAVQSTESHLNCCNSCCLWTAQTSLRNAYLLCRNAIISLLLFLFFKIMGSFFLLSSS